MNTSSPKRRKLSPLKRHMLTALGMVMLGLGALGAVLPLLPTTPFLLAAAACFSRSFPRLERWLLNRKRLGPPLRAWRQSGAISRRAKAMAVGAMLVSYAIFLVTTDVSLALQVLVALVMSCCSTFILSRPNADAIGPEALPQSR